jgi:hypothetical protein
MKNPIKWPSIKWPFAIILLALTLAQAPASEIVRGVTLEDGQTLYASDLHNLIDSATVGAEFYSGKTAIGSLPTGYEFLVYDSGSGLYRRISANAAIYANTNSFLNPSLIAAAPA